MTAADNWHAGQEFRSWTSPVVGSRLTITAPSRTSSARIQSPIIETAFSLAGQRAHSHRDRKVHRRQAQRLARHAGHGVPVLLVVEDNIRYYSSFLPVIYTELIKQSRRVIQEGIQRRPTSSCGAGPPEDSVSSNFEDAAQLVQEYRDYLIGPRLGRGVSLEDTTQPRRPVSKLARLNEGAGAGCACSLADQPH